MYFGQRSFKNLNLDQSILGSTRPISIFGINPQRSPFDFPSIDVQLDKIQNPNVFLFDRQSRPEYGTLSDDFAAGIANVELEGQRITIGGIVDFIGASFGITGNLVTSDVNFLELFPEQNAERIALGIITLKDKTETDRIAQLLESRLPEDIMVLTIPQFVELDKYYWQKTTIVGFVFQMGATIGFLIGLYTVYQILYTEISDAIPDYAILKASGYQNTFFWGLLFQEALILSCSSYIPGYLISIFLYQLFNQGTNVALTMNSGRAFLVLILTFCMCLFSGFLVSKKLKESDPADLF
ncbi:MAG: heterocyst specific ABC-transporter, rane spanning subunit DevC, partial [Cyanobacteriota bacterium]